ncbi:3',5'-cyclic nucleotide phosphodiesterase, putative [Plasmodium berghei]|uniref:Phosphodiesterase n=2 Tax=Plasmodium berghei TaxID=5821 RepID=A0A509AHA2_PLABA|nr:cGMP-specific 3',5'-cyclic phosphodiesterase alpha, putative [Plasmodium berghei ANKA]CXI16922.1 3',5'-cyclic nucleotide phosphodiesterase, putative [Plasmodium berghei]SCM19664.1 3',5'-cyclic nucleotide phosphodiesterase, putative [Plasmodium berghei]SCN23407.1 3',5'-cyclic nucleotide phosphodiesterase, putative [Plasmodium berghei]SCO59067.1 3',5'-cyclic nucleotide phosphodiesterase, putative [Plasmodium berghei]SCO59687.1 3',5'-cyclic nucleotide phosphodiesterase, putative [Plasmodium be|eukprot:XP_034420580.1 cGMP-specific 3',5'-cyclic phosphodiesterase alpha, putative [Plasmodium berghei ANKA]
MIKSNSQSNAGCSKEESFPKNRYKSCSRIKNLATTNFKKNDKELNRSFTFHNNSIKYKKQHSEDIGNYSWTLLNEEAKKEAKKEYEFCIDKNKYKIICILRKYIKYFCNLKKKTYEDNCYTNSLSTTKSIGTFSSSENITNFTNIFNNSSNSIHIYDEYNNGNVPFHTQKKKHIPIFIDYVKMKEKPFNETFSKLKKNEEWSLQDNRIIYFLEKVIISILNIFNKYNNETDEINIVHKLSKIENGKREIKTPFLIFKNENYEEIFLIKFYSSFPFKIMIYSIIMIFISIIHFFILYYILLKNMLYNEYNTIIFYSIFKFILDILYFTFFVIYTFLFNTNCIDKMAIYSYKSCYLFISLIFIHNIVLLHFNPSSFSLPSTKLIKYINKYTYKNYAILLNNAYMCIFCFLRNYIILYNFLLNLKFSIFFIIITIFLPFYAFFFYPNLQTDIYISTFIFPILCVLPIVISLYIQYQYEFNKRITCIDMNENRKKVHSHYITKYFSIDNSIPTSPIEDILTNLKSILDYTKNLEENEEGNDNKIIELNKIQEKIKTCENILRTQNLNEVPVCKYRKFEKVYNMWCLDQYEKKDEINSFLSQNPNKKSVTSFFNMHSLLSTKFQDQYNDIYDWNADIELIYKRNIFISIGYKLLYPLGVLETNFNTEKLKNFLLKIYSLYNDLPYHNSFHAAQVAHFTKSMLFMLDLNQKISGIDEFCLHVSSLCHDVGHPGLNNFFLIKSENELALTYNDSNVLENYHCSLVFKTLKDPSCNIFGNYPNNIFITCKKNIIRAILSTDMKNHFEYISTFRTNREFIDYENLTNDQLWQIFCLILKGSDIGHSTLEWKKHLEWTLKINEEFYLQGLLEKSLNMSKSFLCDTISIDKLAISQIDFLKHLCIPLFNELNYISKNNEIYNNCISAIENNIEQWEKNKNNPKNLGLQEKYQDDNTVEKIKL